MRMRIFCVVITALAIFISISPCIAHDQALYYNPCDKAAAPYSEDHTFANEFTPGISWPALADLMDLHWSPEDLSRNDLYNSAGVEQAIKWVDNVSQDANVDVIARNEYENYSVDGASEEATASYRIAAGIYHNSDWVNAIVAFDKIAADKASPYRAAAAYSAARASLNIGDYHDALFRIHALVADPSQKEFHVAALSLIGTRAYQTYSAQLIAAHYAEIEHLLLSPASRICHDAVARNIYGSGSKYERRAGFVDDLSWYLGSAFSGQDWFVYGERREVLDVLAKHDPFFDIVKALAAPTPYIGDHNWPAVYSQFDAETDKYARGLTRDIEDEKRITVHAREKWQQTKNILWGYVLAQCTADITDLPLIEDMVVAGSKLPDTEAVNAAKRSLYSHFVHHAARVMLMNGQVTDAIKFIKINPISDDQFPVYQSDAYILLNGGIRFFVEKRNLPDARIWAQEAGRLFPNTEIASSLRPLLAASFDEMLTGSVPGDGRSQIFNGRPPNTIPLNVADFLPRQELLALAVRKELEPDSAKALLASGWLRTYLLAGTKAGIDLLPSLRNNFPGLATDIDDISDMNGITHKDRLLTRLLLRSPGFTLRPSWTRTGAEHNRQYSRRISQSLFDLDTENPSDGNWWCSADLDRIKVEMAQEFYASPLGQYREPGLFVDPLVPQLNRAWESYPNDFENQQKLINLADQLIAWHPLLKDADVNELEALSKVENGPRLLSEKAIGWAKSMNWFNRKLGFDKYLPETLHLAIRSTRYGCRRNGSLADVSRKAYVELHERYPASPWSEKTAYWFDQPRSSVYAPNSQTEQTEGVSTSSEVSSTASRSLKARIKSFLRPYWHRLKNFEGKT